MMRVAQFFYWKKYGVGVFFGTNALATYLIPESVLKWSHLLSGTFKYFGNKLWLKLCESVIYFSIYIFTSITASQQSLCSILTETLFICSCLYIVSHIQSLFQ